MNYYEHHLGDYAKDAGHLSLIEEGAYRRLLDTYYTRERPLPADPRECCKLARAVSKPERDAVAYVLTEFFDLTPDGYRQGRADREIVRFQDKQRKARASADARWARSDGNAIASPIGSPNAMRTHSEGNAPRARPQSPIPSPQTPEEKGRARPPSASHAAPPALLAPVGTEGFAPTLAGAVCRAMKKAGLGATNPGDPRLLALLEQGATIDEFEGLAAEAAKACKGFAWVLVALAGRRADAARIALAQPADRKTSAIGARGAVDYRAEVLS